MWQRLLERSSDTPLGASDCERLRPGRIAQPANTITSAGLAAAGVYLMARGNGHRHATRWRTFGSAVTAAGLGSVAYHGPGGRLSHWAHDAATTAMMSFVPVDNLRALRNGSPAQAYVGYAALAGSCGAVLAVRPAWVQEVSGALALAAVLTEARVRDRRPPRARRLERISLGLWATALLAYVTGRTESPTCRPDSWFQPHGLWHLIAGLAVTAWAEAAFADE
jgi:hypothetical protein